MDEETRTETVETPAEEAKEVVSESNLDFEELKNVQKQMQDKLNEISEQLKEAPEAVQVSPDQAIDDYLRSFLPTNGRK